MRFTRTKSPGASVGAMLASFTRNRTIGNIGSAELRVDGLALRRVWRLRADDVLPLRLPEDFGDVVRRLEEVLRGLQVDLLPGLRGGLHRLPREVVELRELLDVLRLEVVAPQDADLVLRNLRVLLLRRD